MYLGGHAFAHQQKCGKEKVACYQLTSLSHHVHHSTLCPSLFSLGNNLSKRTILPLLGMSTSFMRLVSYMCWSCDFLQVRVRQQDGQEGRVAVSDKGSIERCSERWVERQDEVRSLEQVGKEWAVEIKCIWLQKSELVSFWWCYTRRSEVEVIMKKV